MMNDKNYKAKKDPIFKAVVKKMTAKGKGFFIISCGPWIHPLNTVMNCYAILFDGSIQYKFELVKTGMKVAEVRDRHWIDIDVKVGDILDYEHLVTKITEAA